MADGESGLHATYVAERAALLRFLAARTGSAAEAEDLIQELWLKLGAAPTEGPIASPRAYLFRMAQNLVLDRLREQRRRIARDQRYVDESTSHADAGEPRDPDRTAEEVLIAEQEARQLALAIETLPEGARRVLRLHKIDGLSHAEVAARLGISRSGVEKHMAVAMMHLRRAMGELG